MKCVAKTGMALGNVSVASMSFSSYMRYYKKDSQAYRFQLYRLKKRSEIKITLFYRTEPST